MGRQDWHPALGTSRVRQVPFAARKRGAERRQEPPVVTQIALPYRQWDGPGGPGATTRARPQSRSTRSAGAAGAQLQRGRGGEAAPQGPPVGLMGLLVGPGQGASYLASLVHSAHGASAVAQGPGPRDPCRPRVEGRRHTGRGRLDPDDPLETLVLVKCKRQKEDIKESQVDWVAAALERGLDRDNFAVAVRPFA